MEGKQKVKTDTQGVRATLHGLILSICGLAALWSIGRTTPNTSLGRKEIKHHLLHLEALNNQSHVVTKF